jgi:hypothetical protein
MLVELIEQKMDFSAGVALSILLLLFDETLNPMRIHDLAQCTGRVVPGASP